MRVNTRTEAQGACTYTTDPKLAGGWALVISPAVLAKGEVVWPRVGDPCEQIEVLAGTRRAAGVPEAFEFEGRRQRSSCPASKAHIGSPTICHPPT